VDSIRAAHVELQRWIDRAASHGALHKNAAARKKAQAARIVTGR
jgi:ribosomal protein S20